MQNTENKTATRVRRFPSTISALLLCCRKLTATLLVFIGLAAICPTAVYSDTLNDVLSSRELKSMDMITVEKRVEKNKYTRRKLNDEMTNSEMIFQTKGSGLLILSWLNWKLEKKFTSVSEGSGDPKEIVKVWGFYQSKQSRKEYKITVIIPRPTKRFARDMNLITDFKELTPPYLSIVGSEEITLPDAKATLYQKPGHACSILVNIELGGVINIESSDCKELTEINDLANTLDVARLNRKLLN